MTNTTVKQAAAMLPGIGVSLLPKLMCPACWPAYAGVLSAAGLGFLISTKYLLPLTITFVGIAVFALGFRSSRRHGHGPFWIGLLAAAIILFSKFYFESKQATYTGLGLLVAASIWNSWLRRTAALHSCCVPSGRIFTQRSGKGETIDEAQS